MRDKIISLLLQKLQNLRYDLRGSLIGKILRELKIGELLVDPFRLWLIKRGFYKSKLLGQNINFRVSSKSEIDHISMAEKLEGQFIRRLVDVLQCKDVFYDIGAHIGIISLPVAILGKSKEPVIFAFEPHPEIAQRLKENTILNGVKINIFQLAAGNRCGQAKLNVGNFGEGTHTLVNLTSNGKKFIEVPIITIDEFVEQSHPPPNIIKIDVEGYEMKVLLGMKKTLKSNSIRHLFIEAHPDLLQAAGYSEKGLVKWLEKYGFKIIWRIVRGSEIHYQFSFT